MTRLLEGRSVRARRGISHTEPSGEPPEERRARVLSAVGYLVRNEGPRRVCANGDACITAWTRDHGGAPAHCPRNCEHHEPVGLLIELPARASALAMGAEREGVRMEELPQRGRQKGASQQ